MIRYLRSLISKFKCAKKLRCFNKNEPVIDTIIDQIQNDRLTYIEKIALIELVQVVIANEEKSLQGGIVEAGCALGGSAILLAKAKKHERPLAIYDVFGMIPHPSEKDGVDVQERYEEIKSGKSQGIKGDTYYGYENDLLFKVKSTFATYDLDPNKNNISFVKGLYQETMYILNP